MKTTKLDFDVVWVKAKGHAVLTIKDSWQQRLRRIALRWCHAS